MKVSMPSDVALWLLMGLSFFLGFIFHSVIADWDDDDYDETP